MLIIILKFALGFIFLLKGADILIKGASSVAKKYGISNFVIGLTVVAFGTSAPELAVSISAGLKNDFGIVLGNIIGSNISNILLILGISALVHPLVMKKSTVTREITFSLLAVAAALILCNDFFLGAANSIGLSRFDGLILILLFFVFIYYIFGLRRTKEKVLEAIKGEIKIKQKEYNNYVAASMIAAGLAGLVVGGDWIVEGATFIAARLGISEALIGFTIIAVGTSLPELATSAVAAYKKNVDIAVGNVIGSNIFNLLWVLGVSSIVNPIRYSRALNVDFIVLFGVTLLAMFLIYFGKKNELKRIDGATLLLTYFLYLTFLIFRG